jgi:hypothetical protein
VVQQACKTIGASLSSLYGVHDVELQQACVCVRACAL